MGFLIVGNGLNMTEIHCRELPNNRRSCLDRGLYFRSSKPTVFDIHIEECFSLAAQSKKIAIPIISV